MPVTSRFITRQIQQTAYRISKRAASAPYRARLEALGDADSVRRALLEAMATLHALAGCDGPATRGTARDAIRAVEEELNPPAHSA